MIDSIDARTMEHTAWVQRVPAVGTFAWSMDFGWKGGEIKPGAKFTDAIECVMCRKHVFVYFLRVAHQVAVVCFLLCAARQPWLADCFQSTATIGMKSTNTMMLGLFAFIFSCRVTFDLVLNSKWTAGVAKTWKYLSASGNAVCLHSVEARGCCLFEV